SGASPAVATPTRSPPSWPRTSPRHPCAGPAVPQKLSQFRPGCHELGKRRREILARDVLGTDSGAGPGTPLWRDGAMTSTRSPLPSGARDLASWPRLARLAKAGLGPAELDALPSIRSARVLCLC